MNAGSCIVFLGPSLPLSQAQTILDAEFRAPAGQGDIYRACSERPSAIALIDGVFKDAPTVRHREILWAMSRGIPVFGASSMGALRAAELSDQGMIGVGLIYRWYRRFPLLPDDAVAVTHGPAELGSPSLSDALVDIRRSVSAAVRQGIFTSKSAKSYLTKTAAQPFAERRVLFEITHAKVSQKARDARTLLNLLSDHQKNGAWPNTRIDPPPVIHAWMDDLHDSGLQLPEQGE